MNWRKSMIAVTAATMAISLLAGCGTKAQEPKKEAAPAEKKTIEIWAHWGSEQRRPTINKIVDTWNAKNPNIQVKYTFVPFDQIMTKTLSAVAAKNPPDVVVIDIRTTAQRALKNQATDLTALGADQIKDQFFGNLWETGTVNGKQYSLPFVTDTRFLYINKQALKDAGVDPNTPPKTWDEVEALAAKLDKKEGDKFSRIGFYPNWGNFGYEGIVNNFGATLWDAKLENPQVNNDTAVKALAWLKKWTDKYGANTVQAFKSGFGGGAQDAFISGKVGMYLEIGGYASTIAKYKPDMDYAMIPVPTLDGKQHPMASWGGGFVLELPANSKNPKEAFEFAKYMATEGAAIWAKEQNDFPGAKAAAETVTTPAFKAMAENMKYTYVSKSPFYAPSYGTPVSKAVDDVTLKGADPKAALDEAQAAVLKMVQEGKK